MTQRIKFAHTCFSYFWLRSVLLKSVSCIGIFSLLGSNLALAQNTPIDNLIPTNSQAQPQATVAPNTKLSNATHARWRILRQKLYSKQVKPIAVRPVVIRQTNLNRKPEQATIRPVVVQPTKQVTPNLRPVVVGQTNLNRKLETQATIRPVVVQPTNLTALKAKTTQQVKPNPVKPDTISAPDSNGAYIDPTEYKIGATTGYEAPKSVILSERLTGCKAVVQAKLSGSICNPAIKRSLRIARLARSQSGSEFNRNRNTFIAKSGIRPIRVGPISISASGFRVATNSNQRSVLSYYPSFQPTGQSGSAIKGLMFPLTVPAPITSLFGWRIHPITGDQRFHAGTDLGAPMGTPVLAAYPGSVAVADYMGGYGLTVVLNHNKSTQQTLYGHLSEVLVEPGEWVEQGTLIGRVGSTGNSTGPHLHFETRQLTSEGWVAQDPSVQLESAFAHLLKALQTAQAKEQTNQG